MNLQNNPPPTALTIAGSDCSSGAGIQADLKTFSALGVYGLTALTCVVSEIPGKVSQIITLNPSFVCDQLNILAQSFPLHAVKTGMLYTAETVSVLTAFFKELQQTQQLPFLIIDPVMVATSGASLLKEEAIEAYEQSLFPLADLLTPNLAEASTLLGEEIRTIEDMHEAAQQLSDTYSTAILLKGGHLQGNNAVDVLCTEQETSTYAAPFIQGVKTHGTGCTYSAAITAKMAQGHSLKEAITQAKKYITQAIEHHFQWNDQLHALNHRPTNSSR